LRNVGQIRRWLPPLLWAGVIWSFSTGWFSGERTANVILPVLAALVPGATLADLQAMHHAIRKVAHFTEYLVLSVLLYRALRGNRRWNARAAGIAFTLAGLYAVSDEFHQWFVPGRTAAATDCLIDVSGAAAGQGLVAARAPWRARLRTRSSA
jgi:VanZ family protein